MKLDRFSNPTLGALLGVAVLVGCGDDAAVTDAAAGDASLGDGSPMDSGELLTCMEADLALSGAFAQAFEGPGTCATDAECVPVDRQMTCEHGAQFRFCPVAVHVDETMAVDEAIAAALEEVCPRIPPSCVGGAQCVPVRATCDTGRCVLTDPDAGAPDAAASDAAASDAAASDAGPRPSGDGG